MDPQLVGAPGQRTQLQERQAARAPEHAVVRDRGLAFQIDLHPPAALLVAPAERQVDPARLRRRRALDHRPVGLVDPAGGEQAAEPAQRPVVAPEDQAAAGVAIEPMGELRAPRQAEAQSVQEILEVGAALRAGVHREPRRLVDDQHQRVAVQDARKQLLGGHSPPVAPDSRRVGCPGYIVPIAAPERHDPCRHPGIRTPTTSPRRTRCPSIRRCAARSMPTSA